MAKRLLPLAIDHGMEYPHEQGLGDPWLQEYSYGKW
jgi:hypothetical protein